MRLHTSIRSPRNLALTILLSLIVVALISTHGSRAASFEVTTLDDTPIADDGVFSLREAITAANDETANPGADTISFAVTGSLNLTTALPTLSSDITLSGPGAEQLTVTRSTVEGTPEFRILNIASGVTVNVLGLTISGGRITTGDGGGIQNAGSLNIVGCVVGNNSSSANGGGIINSGSLTIGSTAIGFNSAQTGGGISNSGQIQITESIVGANTATSFGGGVANSGQMQITGTTLFGNSATSLGDAVIQAGSTLGITNSTLSGNAGEAMVVAGGEATLTNVTVSSNGAQGIIVNSISAGATLNLLNCTIASNSGVGITSDQDGENFAVVNIRNTIVSANAGSNFSAQDGGAINSFGSNISGDPTGGLTQPTDQPNTNPLLGPLQNNGGSTETHALQPGSPAIDAADDAAPATDQRGVARPQGVASDIGAYELADTTAPTVVSITRGGADETVASGSTVSFTVTFSESVTGVDATDFAATTDGTLTGATITDISGSGTTYIVTGSVGTGTGTIRLDVVDNDSIVDSSGNPLGGTGAGNGSFTTGESYIVVAQCTPPPTGMVAWLAGDGDATDSVGSNNGIVIGGVGFESGKVASGFNFGADAGYVAIEDAPEGALDLTGDLTIDAWINPQPDPSPEPTASPTPSPTPFTRTIVSKRSGDDANVSYELFLRGGRLGFAARADGVTSELLTEVTAPTNTFTHVAATVEDIGVEGVKVTLYGNGTVVASATVASPITRPDTAGRVTIGAAELGEGEITTSASPFLGLIDEVELFNRALSQSEIQAIVAADASGKCKPTQLTTEDDAYVRGATPDDNFGESPELQVKRTLNPGNGKGRQAYLRFDTSSVEGGIERAILRVYGGLSSVTPENINLPVAVFPVSDQEWTEETITWNNKPAPNVPAPLARLFIRNYRTVFLSPDDTPGAIVPDATPRWYDFDITDFVNQERAAGRKVGMLLRNMASGGIGDFYTRFNSKEAEENRPRLILNVAPPVPSVSKPR